SLLKGNLAVVLADKANRSNERETDALRPQTLDEALTLARENFQESEKLGLLYSRFEGHRCLADVHFRRGELDEAERVCAATAELLAGTDSRVCRLWLGPLYMDVLLAGARVADSEMKPDIAATKRQFALSQLESYQQLVVECESPRLTREAERLAAALPK